MADGMPDKAQQDKIEQDGVKQDRPKVLRDTDDEARRLARELVRGSRYMALAVLEPQTGFPFTSRVLTGTDIDGAPVILVSALSGHTKGLVADPRCSLLAGEPGKGDPLAHPRITVQCIAESIARDEPQHLRLRQRFLARHAKAELYVDFPDFRFFRLAPQSASLNGGFGRAYALSGADLLIPEPGDPEQWLALRQKVNLMVNESTALAEAIRPKNGRKWQFAGVDRSGIDLVSGDTHLRREFDTLATDADAVFAHICNIAKII